MSLSQETATSIAADIRTGARSATEVAKATLDRANRLNPQVNAFTEITESRALADAAEVDAALARGETVGPLAGVPYAVKNLFDIEGVTTLAGSIIERDRPPAAADGWAVTKLREAGGVCIGALNMDEYAYGFTTENQSLRPCPQPARHGS